MKVHVNGREVELAGPTALTDYLAELGIDPRAVAVEINGKILDRSEFMKNVLQESDRVEIVRMVGGGR